MSAGKAVQGGERIGGNFSAAEWNSVRTRSSRLAMRDAHSIAGVMSDDSVDGVVTIKNTTGLSLAPGSVVGLATPFILPSENLTEFRSTIQFSGALPTAAYAGRFGILLDGCAPGGFAPATIHGVCWANVVMQRATDPFADVYPGTTSVLKSGPSGGAQILYHFPSSSSYPQATVAYVRLSNYLAGSGLIRARLTHLLDDDYPQATATDWEWNSQTEEYYDTEREVELQCFLRPPREKIAARTRVYYAKIGTINEIIVCNCEPDPEEETPP